MKSKLILAVFLAFSIVTAACSKPQDGGANNASAPGTGGAGANVQQTKSDTYPNAQLLVDVKWVEENAKKPNVKIIDARSKGYEQGHIPGAVHISSSLLKDGPNNAIVSKEKFTELLQNAGVNSDSTILVYDEGGSMNATRLFYAAEYYGLKDRVKVLNGGFLAWNAAGKDVSTDIPALPKGNFVAQPNPKLITTKEELMKLDLKQCTLLDTRSSKEYSGEDLRAKKGGHIEGAVNKEWSEALVQNPADGVPVFLGHKELKEAYDKAGVKDLNKTVIPYCQTNIRGAHSYFTLRLLGFTDIRPYEGSWAEWGNADDTKVVK